MENLPDKKKTDKLKTSRKYLRMKIEILENQKAAVDDLMRAKKAQLEQSERYLKEACRDKKRLEALQKVVEEKRKCC